MALQAPWASRLGTTAVIAVAVAVFGAYLWVALGGIAYPYSLEWMEGGSIDVVARVVAGKSIYAPASLDYVPYIYAPLYYIVAGLLSKPFGAGFLVPRLVSLFSVIGTAWLSYAVVHRQTGERLAALCAPVLYVATYELCGRWFHLARVDSLFVLGLVASLWLLLRPAGRRGDILCGVVMAATVLTKQTGLLAFAPLGLWLVATDRRRGLWVGGVSVGLLALTLVVSQWVTDGRFVLYLWTIPSSHDLVVQHATGFWIEDLRQAWPMLLGSTAVVLLPGPWRERAFWGAVGFGFVGSAWLSRMHSGGALNALMPAVAAAGLATAVVLGRAVKAARDRGKAGGVQIAVGFALAGQVAWLGLPSFEGRPTTEHVDKGDRFLAYLEGLPGDVLLPDHRFVQTRAGKTSYGLGMAAADLLRSDAAPEERRRLEEEIVDALTSHRFSHVLLTVRGGWISAQVKRHYCMAHAIDFAPVPVAGAPHRPRWVLVPRGDPACNKRRIR